MPRADETFLAQVHLLQRCQAGKMKEKLSGIRPLMRRLLVKY
jgi:hypothetical protein